MTSWTVTQREQVRERRVESSPRARAGSARRESSRGGPGGCSGDSATSYWPSTRREQVADERRRSARRARPPATLRSGAGRGAGAARRASRRAASIVDAQQREVRARPLAAADGLGARQRRLRARARCRRRRPARPRPRARRGRRAGRLAAPPSPARPDRDALGELPADHGRRGSAWRLGEALRASAPRRPGCGRRGRRAPRERVAPRPERDEAAALAHDQLRRGGVDRAAAAQRGHPVDARRGDLAERDRDRAERADAVDVGQQGVRRSGEPARRGRLDRRRPRGARRRSGARAADARAARRRATPRAALGAPLLAGAEVVDVAEHDVGHRRPVGDRDRQRVVRRGRAWRSASRRSGRRRRRCRGRRSRRTPRSSETSVKRAPCVVERPQLAEDEVLGALVDDQRAVAADADDAGLLDALGGPAALCAEHRAHPLHRAPAGAEPVVLERRGGRGHPLRTLGMCRHRSRASPSASARS